MRCAECPLFYLSLLRPTSPSRAESVFRSVNQATNQLQKCTVAQDEIQVTIRGNAQGLLVTWDILPTTQANPASYSQQDGK